MIYEQQIATVFMSKCSFKTSLDGINTIVLNIIKMRWIYVHMIDSTI